MFNALDIGSYAIANGVGVNEAKAIIDGHTKAINIKEEQDGRQCSDKRTKKA